MEMYMQQHIDVCLTSNAIDRTQLRTFRTRNTVHEEQDVVHQQENQLHSQTGAMVKESHLLPAPKRGVNANNDALARDNVTCIREPRELQSLSQSSSPAAKTPY